MPLDTGTQLGPYTIRGPLGVGGMGEVYKATDTRLDRSVAADPDRKQRFQPEARTVAALNHPHICTLHDIGRQDGMSEGWVGLSQSSSYRATGVQTAAPFIPRDPQCVAAEDG